MTDESRSVPAEAPLQLPDLTDGTLQHGEESRTIEAQEESAQAAISGALVQLGFVCFDANGADNATSGVMVAEEKRRYFKRDVYVGIQDREQGKEFLGRVVEGPFHAPHEVGTDSAITRTTILHPERTRFRPTYYAFGSIEILGEITGGERVVPSSTRPRPYSDIYIFPAERLRQMLGISGDFYLGHLMGYDGVQVHADVSSKNFLPRNLGIFGTVGSGKSNTTQVVMEEALAAGWAVVVIDVEGEYVRMNEATADVGLARLLQEAFARAPTGVPDLRVYVPSSGQSDAANPIRFKCPIAAVQPEVIADILEFSEPQVRMFASITTAAAAKARSAVSSGSSRQGVLAGAAPSVSSPGYTLGDLIAGLTEDDSGALPLLPRISSTEKPTASTLRTKLVGLARSQMLDWGPTSAIPVLPISDLLVGGRLSVLDVSETDDRSRNIAIAYTLQALFNQVIETPVGEEMSNGIQRPRVLVVIEEVHTFVSKAAAARMRSVMDNLQIISRRGRKRWMALALVSQQPGHVPDELFELANTRFIHQLKSVSNLAPVKATTGGVHEALWTTVPALASGQCLITGAIFKNPIFVNMRPGSSRRLLSGD